MKKYILSTALFFVINAISLSGLFAQDLNPGVIYLKDGSIYKGYITQLTSDADYEIKVAEGTTIHVAKGDIDSVVAGDRRTIVIHDTIVREYSRRPGRVLPPYGYKEKGYFFQAQFNIQYAGGGFRVINGYKINQYAFIGLGLGVGGAALGVNGPRNIDGDHNPFSGLYAPFFLYYSGDILQKDITPFYAVEIGYGIGASSLLDDDAYDAPIHTLTGGAMGSADFGVRFYAGRRSVFSISANLDIQQVRTNVVNEQSYYINEPEFVSKSITMLLPSLKIGMGLVK